MARGGGPPRPRHVPQRTCVACRAGRAKRELVRVVRGVDGSVGVDPSGKRSGRGAYLCRAAACWEAGLDKRAVISRALKLDSIPADDYTALVAFASSLEAANRPAAAVAAVPATPQPSHRRGPRPPAP